MPKVFAIVFLFLATIAYGQTNGEVLIIIPDGAAPIAYKTARFVDDFVRFNTKTIRASEYVKGMERQYGASVVMEETSKGGITYMNVIIRTANTVSSSSGVIRINNSIPQLVLYSLQAMDAAINILKVLDEAGWKELVELFKDPVADLDD